MRRLAIALLALTLVVACGGEDSAVTGTTDGVSSTGSDNGTGAATTDFGAAPACSDQCSPQGLKRCNGTAVQTCGDYNADGCFEWGGDQACPTGGTCTNGACAGGTTPAACTNDCTTAGARQCAGAGFQTCGNFDEDNCLEWGAVAQCEAGQSCSNGQCAAGCSDECSEDGAARCEGNTVRTCGNHDADTCLEWSAATPCPSGQTCSNGACQAGCTDECTVTGATSCEGNGVKTCGNNDADTCLEWGTVVPCGPGNTCSGGQCGADCTEECTVGGATQCSGTGVQTCGNHDADTCKEWGSVVQCGDGESCSAGVCSTPSGCEDECTVEGATQCSGNAVQICGNTDEDTCKEWGTAEACGAGQFCSNGACGTTCIDECPADGETRCDGAGVQSCGNTDPDPCLEWGTTVACGAGESCSGGACASTADCANDCETAGATRCDGPIGVQECGDFDDDACTEWGTTTFCNVGQICEEGTGACTDVSGELSCAEVDDCFRNCGTDGECALGCVNSGTTDAQGQFEDFFICSLAFGCQDFGCLAAWCSVEFAGCFLPTAGTNTCGQVINCVNACDEPTPEDNATCAAGCEATAAPDAAAEYAALFLCLEDACPNPEDGQECWDEALAPLGACGPYSVACGADAGGTSTCPEIGACLDGCTPADEECQGGCIDAGSSVGQNEFIALNLCLARNDCVDLFCWAENCATEHSQCLYEEFGGGTCLDVFDCMLACPVDGDGSCEDACMAAGLPVAQAFVSAINLCVTAACPEGGQECIDEAAETVCADYFIGCAITSEDPDTL